MAFDVELAEGAQHELNSLRAFDHRRVLEAIATQLANQPNVETRNRKTPWGGIDG